MYLQLQPLCLLRLVACSSEDVARGVPKKSFLVPKTMIWEAWCFHFGILGAILASWGHPGRPCEQQEGHVGIHGRIFSDFGVILGPHFESFSGAEG